MGVLNVTPDSFSDGGRHAHTDAAVAHGLRMIDQGADFIDVGGESTRPGADPVPLEEELRRVLPVIELLRARSDVPISIDTTKPGVAERALDAGAVIVNDISGLRPGPALADVAASRGASMVLMHMQGTPKTMQQDPVYADLMTEIGAALEEGVLLARSRGVSQVIVDPGIGFGKLLGHNLEILRSLHALDRLGCPVLVGPSRKSFLGQITGLEAGERLHATAGAVAVAAMQGAHIVRVHDVREMRQVAQVVDAVLQPSR
jgi:dihydropteroate synthase